MLEGHIWRSDILHGVKLLTTQLVFCFNRPRVETRKIGKVKSKWHRSKYGQSGSWEPHKRVTFFWSLIEFFLLPGKTQSQICFRLKLENCTFVGNTPIDLELIKSIKSLDGFSKFQFIHIYMEEYGCPCKGRQLEVAIWADATASTSVMCHLPMEREHTTIQVNSEWKNVCSEKKLDYQVARFAHSCTNSTIQISYPGVTKAHLRSTWRFCILTWLMATSSPHDPQQVKGLLFGLWCQCND